MPVWLEGSSEFDLPSLEMSRPEGRRLGLNIRRELRNDSRETLDQPRSLVSDELGDKPETASIAQVLDAGKCLVKPTDDNG